MSFGLVTVRQQYYTNDAAMDIGNCTNLYFTVITVVKAFKYSEEKVHK